MDPELRDLLRTTATDCVGDSHTHVSLYGQHARWTIRPHNLTNFWTGYCDLVDRKTNGRDGVPPDPSALLCLAERPQEVMPTIARLLFRFQTDPNDNQNWEPYDDEFLQALCSTYQTVLAEYFRITTDTQLELAVAVLESTTHWYEEKEEGQRFMNMEVRLQFPYARIDAGMQNRIVRPRVIQLLRNNNIMSKMQRQPIGDWEQIISSAITDAPVLMYGSSDEPGRPKLTLTHIWGPITSEMIESGIQPGDIDLCDAFVPINHSHVNQRAVDAAIFDSQPDLKYWIPMFLSLGYWPSVLMPREEVNDGGRFTTQLRMMNTQNEQQRIFGTGGRPREEVHESDSELCERMLPMIDQKRFFREAFWIDIGRALYMSNEAGENGLRSWIRHTERALVGVTEIPEYMRTAETLADTCGNLYKTFANSSITVRTLAWYAREDSRERYSNWHRDWCMSSMERALSCLHTDVSEALHRVYWLDFAYCPIGKGKWFQFKNHRWFEAHQGIALRKAISSDFMRRFEKARAVLTQHITSSNDDSFKANAEISVKKITSLIAKLKTVGFKNSVMMAVCEEFSDEKFMSLLDSNSDLTGVTNGVLEVLGNHVLFRSAKPEDYVSMCTNVPFSQDYTWKNPLVQECMKWLGQVFGDRPLLHHFLKFAASCLKGRNSDKIFPIFTGEGDNSKSMIVKLFEATFSSYCIKFDMANVTGRNSNASGATPQLARAKSTRIAFMDEPADDVPMNKEVIKRWVGGDSFFSRFLHDNGSDVQVTFKLVLTCNKVPVIPNADKAIKNRTRLFPFLATWVDDAPEDEAEQYRLRRFKRNQFFERRIPILAPAFLWIMSQYYPHYATEGLTDPSIVTETTETYWRENDIYAQFAADSIQEVYNDKGERDAAARATLSEIYSEFKLWFRDAFPGTKVPERSVVRSELSSRWGRLHGNAWHGIRVVTENGPTDITTALGGNKNLLARPAAAPERPNIIAPTAKVAPKPAAEPRVSPPVVAKPPSPMRLVVTKPPTPPIAPRPDMTIKPVLPAAPLTPTQRAFGIPNGSIAI